MIFSAKNHMEHDDKSTGLRGTLRRREKSKNVKKNERKHGDIQPLGKSMAVPANHQADYD